jgi:cobyrinic acid a,c-diamide synthase
MAKVGPDFIDPSLSKAATGEAAYNIDAVMTGPGGAMRSLARAGHNKDLLIVEGAMGLFDGTDIIPGVFPEIPAGSSAEIAALACLPVLLVLDATGTSRTLMATATGMASYSNQIQVKGLVINRLASSRHLELVAGTGYSSSPAAPSLPIMGWLLRNEIPERKSRRLGLYDFEAEDPRKWVDSIADRIEERFDLAAVLAMAKEIDIPSYSHEPKPTRARIAVTGGESASFSYRENLEILEEAGFEVVIFDPLAETVPEETHALWLSGGYPELHARAIGENQSLMKAISSSASRSMPIVAECGGHQLLGMDIEGVPMAGVLPHSTTIGDRLVLGYRRLVLAPGYEPPFGSWLKEPIVTHEFHYGSSEPAGKAISVSSRAGTSQSGYTGSALLSSYFHIHLGANTDLASALVVASENYRRKLG